MRFKFIMLLLMTILLNGCQQSTEKNLRKAFELTKKMTLKLQFETCQTNSMLNATDKPTKIYIAVFDCIKKKKYQRAAVLYALAGTYSYYDALRAGNTLSLKQHNELFPFLAKKSGMTKAEHKNFGDVLTHLLLDKNKLIAICRRIELIGKPLYSIESVLQNNTKASNNLFLQSHFLLSHNEKSSQHWQAALKNYLKCI